MSGEPQGPFGVPELRQRVETLRSEGAPSAWVASALQDVADALARAGDLPGAKRVVDELAALHRAEPGDAGVELFGCLAASNVQLLESEVAQAEWTARRAVKLGRSPELTYALGYALVAFSEASEALGRTDAALEARREAVATFLATGAPMHAASSLLWLSWRGPDEEFKAMLDRAEQLAVASDAPAVLEWILKARGVDHRTRGEYLPARRAFEGALKASRAAGGQSTSDCLVMLAWLDVLHARAHDGLALADAALEAARTPEARGYAHRARGEALGLLHRHRESHQELMRASREFKAAGNPGVAARCRRRARHQLGLLLRHLAPRWLVRCDPKAAAG